MNNNLKPCPFCGTTPEVGKHMLGGFILRHVTPVNRLPCILDRVDGPLATSETREAIGFTWNQRACPDPFAEAFNSGDGSYKP
jgi:hypothetical protein